jgi:hypothetical protein
MGVSRSIADFPGHRRGRNHRAVKFLQDMMRVPPVDLMRLKLSQLPEIEELMIGTADDLASLCVEFNAAALPPQTEQLRFLV